jgi:hypothetical protein
MQNDIQKLKKIISAIIVLELIIVFINFKAWLLIPASLIEWKEITSALLGAIVGGLLTSVPSYLQFKHTLQKDIARQKTIQDEALRENIFKCSIKLRSTANLLINLYLKLPDDLKHAPASKESWKSLRPISSIITSQKFTAEELMPLSEKHQNLINNILILADRYESVTSSYEKYNDVRINYGHKKATLGESHKELKALIEPMASLAAIIVTNLQNDAKNIPVIVQKYNDAIKEILGDENYIALNLSLLKKMQISKKSA